jgi:hypothetical protein
MNETMNQLLHVMDARNLVNLINGLRSQVAQADGLEIDFLSKLIRAILEVGEARYGDEFEGMLRQR